MKSNRTLSELFGLGGKVALITGGAGLLGREHADIIASAGGIAVLADRDGARLNMAVRELERRHPGKIDGVRADVTKPASVKKMVASTVRRHRRLDILINNAANNPKVEARSRSGWSRLENFPLRQWNDDIAVGLTGVFLCSQAAGAHMAAHGGGVIVNMASNLGMVSPDQRIYEVPGRPAARQMKKPVSYSAVKGGVINLTRYLATYWAKSGVRANSISPGGVEAGQDRRFIRNYSSRVPLGRMAARDEYRGAILFLCSNASSYMTGANLVVDGGWTAW